MEKVCLYELFSLKIQMVIFRMKTYLFRRKTWVMWGQFEILLQRINKKIIILLLVQQLEIIPKILYGNITTVSNYSYKFKMKS